MAEEKTTKKIDRRYIFLFIFIGVALPLIFTIGLPIETTKYVEMAYEMVDQAPAGSRVLISFDYDPASKPELHPMAKAVINHCFRKDLKVVATALWPMGVSMANDIFSGLEAEHPDKVYGEDYVNMGYKAGGIVTVQAMGKNFRTVFPNDTRQNKIDDLPILDDINNFSNFDFIFCLSAGEPGIIQWVMVGRDKYGIPVSGGVTAVSAPSIMPYVNEQQQLHGLLGGLKAAAEYELLIDLPGTATAGMDAQSIAHLIIIMFIVLGNINYWRNKKRSGNKE